jgi:hypothetical protein
MADTQAILQPIVLHTATVATVAPAATAHPGPVAAVAFACTPAQAQTDLLNYELPGDTKIFLSATTKLSSTFSLNKPNVTILLNALGD